MKLHIHIRPLSAIHNFWKKQHLKVGFLHHTRFEYDIRTGLYHAVEPFRDLEKLIAHKDVEVEAASEPIPAKASVASPESATAEHKDAATPAEAAETEKTTSEDPVKDKAPVKKKSPGRPKKKSTQQE